MATQPDNRVHNSYPTIAPDRLCAPTSLVPRFPAPARPRQSVDGAANGPSKTVVLFQSSHDDNQAFVLARGAILSLDGTSA